MDTTVEYRYITRKEKSGEPIIKGTNTSVRAIVENWRLGLSPEEIVEGLPHLTRQKCLRRSAITVTIKKK